MVKKTGGETKFKSERYIRKIIYENKHFYKYEIPIMFRAFKKTLKYLLENCIEFTINDFCEFKPFHKKDSNIYVRYKNDYTFIPEHKDMKVKASKNLKDFLNYRKKFENARHREYLPDGFKNINNEK